MTFTLGLIFGLFITTIICGLLDQTDGD